MKAKWLNRYDEETKQIEQFYPITHAKAVIYGDDGNTTFEDVGVALSSQLSDTFTNVDLLEKALTLSRGIYYFKSTCTNRPTTDNSGYHVIVSTRANGESNPAIKLIAYGYDSEAVYYNTYNPEAKVWSGWTTHFLPLSGGTLTGDLIVNTAIVPDVAGGANLGTTALPFTQVMSRNYSLFDSSGNRIVRAYTGKLGTTSEIGTAYLLAGNNIASGTNGNSKGMLVLYGDGQYYAQINAANGLTANRTINLPDATGTVALTGHKHAAGDITSGTLPVSRGGTGVVSITSGNALIGAGTGAITSRAITNNTSNTTALTRNTNLVTANTVSYFLNRTSALVSDNTGYTTYCARAIALTNSVPSSVTNGTIAFVYE